MSYPQLYWKARSSARILEASGKGDLYPFYISPFDHLDNPLWKDFSKESLHTFAQLKEVSIHPRSQKKIEVKKASFYPNFSDWKDLVHEAKKKIHQKEFSKVVLARVLSIESSSLIDAFSLFSSFLEQKDLYVFYFSPKKDVAFIGSSPERLLKKEEHLIYTEALAGTRKIALKEELLKTSKELEEFGFVEKGIKKSLSPFMKHLEISSKNLTKSQNLFHLSKSFKGELLSEDSLDSLLENLHPTPAILGDKKDACRAFLSKHEPFSRGLYCGAFGPKNAKSTDLCVAIRSALIKKNTLHLFSGVGIVEDSDPEMEWNELNDKIDPYLKHVCLSV